MFRKAAKLQSYFENALSTLKSKFGALKHRFDHLSSSLTGSSSEKKRQEEMRRDYIVPYYDDPWFNQDFWHPWNQLAQLDRDLFDLGRELSSWDREFNAMSRWLNNRTLLDDRDFLTPPVESMVPGIDESSGKYIMNVPLSRHMSPEDVRISMKNNVMTIEGRKEQKSEDGRSRSYHEFMRKFTLPENVKPEDVRSVLTPEGYLKIEAPLPQPALMEPEKPKEIPIEFA